MDSAIFMGYWIKKRCDWVIAEDQDPESVPNKRFRVRPEPDPQHSRTNSRRPKDGELLRSYGTCGRRRITSAGLLDKQGGRRCHLLLMKRWHLLPPFVSNEPGTERVSKSMWLFRIWEIRWYLVLFARRTPFLVIVIESFERKGSPFRVRLYRKIMKKAPCCLHFYMCIVLYTLFRWTLYLSKP
jgi:hypothetical protein